MVETLATGSNPMGEIKTLGSWSWAREPSWSFYSSIFSSYVLVLEPAVSSESFLRLRLSRRNGGDKSFFEVSTCHGHLTTDRPRTVDEVASYILGWLEGALGEELSKLDPLALVLATSCWEPDLKALLTLLLPQLPAHSHIVASSALASRQEVDSWFLNTEPLTMEEFAQLRIRLREAKLVKLWATFLEEKAVGS